MSTASKSLTLIIGGARSGKSSLAERIASGYERVLFVATAGAGDEEMTRRIAAHRASRPDNWDTLEEEVDVAHALSAQHGMYDVILVDCLTLWASNMMLAARESPNYDAACDELLRNYDDDDASWVVVTNEVGLGVVPPTESGRLYRDALGRINAAFARRADRVISMTAGLALELKSLGARPWDRFDA